MGRGTRTTHAAATALRGGGSAYALQAPASRSQPPAPRIDNARAQTLLQAQGVDVGVAISDGRFYHVVANDRVASIAEQGLLTPNETSLTNYPGLHVEQDCVYAWPSVGLAYKHLLEEDRKRVAEGGEELYDRSGFTIVQIDDIDDYTYICPDHEYFAHMWERDMEYEDPEDPIVAALLELRERFGDEDDLPPFGEPLEFDQAADLITRMDQGTRMLLANQATLDGDAVMFRHAIPAHMLSKAVINDHDELWLRFEEHELDREETGDDEDAIQDAFFDWLETQAADGEMESTSHEALRERFAGLESSDLADNNERVLFSSAPLDRPY